MTTFKRLSQMAVIAAMVISPLLITGCAGTGVGVRVYDPYRRDYHYWDGDEAGFYTRWTVETHRDGHRDFRKLSPGDRDEYWRWRHDHH